MKHEHLVGIQIISMILIFCCVDGTLRAHSWSLARLEKPTVELLKNFPAFYGTQKFITVFTGALLRSLS
jgi:hypothetical protein